MELVKVIYSLCDYTGEWCKPYRDNGYDVYQIDLKYGQDARLLEIPPYPVYGIVAAPDCNAFAGSGAQYWPDKDADGRTLAGLELVAACCRFILATQPHFWAIENPIGRLNKWLGEPTMRFNPCDYGDPYTKKTNLWGVFNIPVKNQVEPEKVCSQGSWVQTLGGSSERTKTLRSSTPPGFAQAFYEAKK